MKTSKMMVGTYNNNCNGVYGNTPDCYANGSYEHYQYHHHHYYQDHGYPHSDYCTSTNRLDSLPKQYNNSGYYDSMLGYEYNSTSSTDVNDSRRSDESHYYAVQHQHYHQDDVNIITSSNGLSYTNLDYANADNFSYHQKSTSPKEFVSYETLESKRDTESCPQRQDECHENLDYLHQSAISEEQYHGTSYGSSVKEESHFHPHTTSSSTLSTLPDYHQSAVPLHHMHQNSPHHPHHHHQPHGGSSTSSQSNVPTYKWMQVKRNVPKPGNLETHFFFFFFSTGGREGGEILLNLT